MENAHATYGGPAASEEEAVVQQSQIGDALAQKKRHAVRGLQSSIKRGPVSLSDVNPEEEEDDEGHATAHPKKKATPERELILDTIDQLDFAMDRMHELGKMFDAGDYAKVLPLCENALVDVESLRDRIRDYFKFRLMTKRAAEESRLNFSLQMAAELALFRNKYYMHESRAALDRAALLARIEKLEG